MLKADLSTATRVLTNLFDTIWDKETISSDWGKWLIIKILKKCDLQVCDNWRGITLLSIPSKVFCIILLGRTETALDKKLRQEQAGFRKRRGCTDQIFALRNIIEQTLEWNSARLGKARCALAKLQNIWKSNQYTTKTKIRLYNSNVKSILLYGSECWRVVKGDMA